MAAELAVPEQAGDEQFLSKNVAELHQQRLSPGQRLADRMSDFAGSWVFISAFFAFLVAWMAANTVLLLRPKPFDPYPFILLNLILSCLAAIQAPVIMMSQNRRDERDRLRDEHDFEINLKAEQEVAHIQDELDQLRQSDLARLVALHEQQIAVLQEVMMTLRGTQQDGSKRGGAQ